MKIRYILAASTAAAIVLAGLGLAPAQAAADQTIAVNYSSSAGAFTRTGAGFHYGFSEDGTLPADSLVTPTAPNLDRGGGAQLLGLNGSTDYGWLGDGYQAGPGFQRRMNYVINVSKRVTSAPINSRYALLLSDIYGLDAGEPNINSVQYPCAPVNGQPDCSNYVTFLNAVIDQVLSNNLNIYYWEIQNEPDNPPFWAPGINNAQYYAMWDTAYRTIKARVPSARIAGPSYFIYSDDKAGPFLDHVKAAGTIPDVFTWHGLIRTDPVTEATSLRALLSARSIPEMPFSINEYLYGGGTPNDRASNQLNPGGTAYYLNRLNVAGVASAARGIYPNPLDNYAGTNDPYEGFCCSVPNLAGIIPVGSTTKTDEYWTYATYGGMSGTRYNVTNGTRVVGTATADGTKKQGVVLLGDDTQFQGSVQVNVSGLGSQASLKSNSQVRVTVVRIPSTAGALTGPETVSQSVVTVPSSGSISVPFTWIAPRDAYAIYLTNPTVSTTTPNLGANVVTNPGFESDGSATQTPAGWLEYFNASAGYTEGTVGVVSARSGNYRLTHYSSSDYQAFTYQILTVPNGTYTASAWVVRGGGQISSYIEAKDFGGATLQTTIPVTTTWQKITIPNIVVANGQLTIGIYDNAHGGNWTSIDDFQVNRTS